MVTAPMARARKEAVKSVSNAFLRLALDIGDEDEGEEGEEPSAVGAIVCEDDAVFAVVAPALERESEFEADVEVEDALKAEVGGAGLEKVWQLDDEAGLRGNGVTGSPWVKVYVEIIPGGKATSPSHDSKTPCEEGGVGIMNPQPISS